MKNEHTENQKIATAADPVPVQLINVADIIPDPKNQQRNDPVAIARLAKSIDVDGLLQPVILRPNPDPLGGKYVLMAGERRWRAHLLLKRTQIEARVYTSEEQLAVVRKRAIENLDRENLNPIQEARQFQELLDSGMSQTEAAERAGCDQSTMSNRLRVLRLRAPVVEMIEKGELTRAHGIALLRFEQWPAVCEAIARLAVESHTPSKNLEKGVPFADELAQEKLIGKIYGTDRDDAQKQHPAYIDGEYGWWYCMDRKVHDQLQREKSKRKREKLAKEVEKAGGKPGAKAEKYAVRNYAIHEELRESDADLLDLIPAEKKVLLLGWRGASKPTLFCNDKKLIQKLRDEQGGRIKKQMAFDGADARTVALKKAEGMTAMPKAGAVWAVLMIECYAHLRAQEADRVAKEHGIAVFRIKAENQWNTPPINYQKTAEAWSKIPAGKLCQMLLDATLASEVGSYLERGKPEARCLAVEYLLGKPVRLFSAKSRELEDGKPKPAGLVKGAQAAEKPARKKKDWVNVRAQAEVRIKLGYTVAEIAKYCEVSEDRIREELKTSGSKELPADSPQRKAILAARAKVDAVKAKPAKKAAKKGGAKK